MLRRSRTDDATPTRVLVADDDPDACELIARIVESAGWVADRAFSEESAMGLLQLDDPPFKAVVADFQVAGTGASMKLLDSIRRAPAFEELPVLILARNASQRLYAWDRGVDGFLVRPFHADELINEIYAVLTRTPDEREAIRQQQLSGS